MKKILSLSLLKQTLIYSSIVVIIAFLISSFCFTCNLRDVPLGILFGGLCSIGAFSLFLIKENARDIKTNLHFTIFSIVMMSVIHILALVISALVSYVAKVQLFNIFSTFASLFVCTIVYAIVSLIEDRRKRK